MENLFNGIVVIIDDEIFEEGKNIHRLVQQLEEKNIPTVKYDQIPDLQVIDHLLEISFLILDWKLTPMHLPSPEESHVKLPSTLSESMYQTNIEFLKEIINKCFCPVFIFTDENLSNVKNKLIDSDLYDDNRPNFIFTESKSNLIGGQLFDKIENWIKNDPPMYVLKEWEKEYKNAKNKLFSDMYKSNPCWPSILWNTYMNDGINQSRALGEMISRNLQARMAPFEFQQDSIKCDTSFTPSTDEMRNVLEGERYISSDQLHVEAGTGDLFIDPSRTGNWKYLLNITAQCDLARCNNPTMFCLIGREIDESKIGSTYPILNHNGNISFIPKEFQEIVPFVINNKIIEFSFKRYITNKKWNELKEYRKGRLLAPFINKIQQKFAGFLHRQGIPAIPDIAFPILQESAPKN